MQKTRFLLVALPAALIHTSLAGSVALAQNSPAAPAQNSSAPAQNPPAGAQNSPATAPAPQASTRNAPAGRVLTLDEAVRTAEANLPELRQAQASSEAARARASQARSSLLPQVQASASYERSGGEGSSLSGGEIPGSSTDRESYNAYRLNAGVSQVVFSGGQVLSQWRAAKLQAKAQELTEEESRLEAVFSVRSAWFGARAQQELLEVARQALENEERHLAQVQAFVEVGTRPEIDLAQARLARANARLQLIEAENAYESAKAQLNRSMGVEGSVDYRLADQVMAPVDGESIGTDAMLEEALRARPAYTALERQLEAQRALITASRSSYFPQLSVGAGVSEAGTELDDLSWGWYGGVYLSWNLFDGLRTPAATREARANVASLEAERDAFRQGVRLEVEQARLAVRAAAASVEAADEALVNARERLRLAEGRYETGVGSILELEDAQLARTQAEAQKVQSTYNLATARAQLLRILARK